jgi:hypothetical protein
LGKPSLRQWFNEQYSTDKVKLRYFEVGFDNICDLTCDGCWEEWSSSWWVKKNPNLPPKQGITSTVTASNISNNSAITINGDPTNGSMKVDVPLIVNGRDVVKELDEMRDALLLLKCDVDMEAKYPRLKELKDEYEAALAKYQTFEAIKESK